MLGLLKRRAGQRRALLIYLFAIVAPALGLLFLGMQSVQRQRQAINSLSASNLRLSAENIAKELERSTGQLANACLKDPALKELGVSPHQARNLEGTRKIRVLLEEIKKRHPIAGPFFILDRNGQVYPLVSNSPPRQLGDYLADEPGKLRPSFAAIFLQAEDEELRQGRPGQAISLYQKSYELPVTDSLKALALSRIARCAEKLDQLAAAQRAYETLKSRYAALYDPFHRPYGVTATLELDRLSRAQGRASNEDLRKLYDDVIQGRWELTTENLNYFVAVLRDKLGQNHEPPERTEYLAEHELAAALAENFPRPSPLREGQVYSYAFLRHDNPYQVYYQQLESGTENTETIIGFAIDLSLLKNELLPSTLKQLAFGDLKVSLVPTESILPPSGLFEARAGFSSVLPFWNLSVKPGSVPRKGLGTYRDVVPFAGAILLVLFVLAMGVFMLIRDVSRGQQLNRLRADLISAVSHDLKTPITLIRLYAETLLCDDSSPESDRRMYHQIINDESERLTHLIAKILTFSRIEAGRKQYQFRKGDLAPVVSRTVNVYSQYLKRRGFSVEADLGVELPPVEFDQEAVSGAVLNLLDNAAKYSVDSKWIGIRLISQQNEVLFEVEDRGVGIQESEYEKIFQQFYRAPSDSGKGGYGLGLFLVKHVMDAHGGRIEVRSKAGAGSTFRLFFPKAASSSQAVQRLPSTPS